MFRINVEHLRYPGVSLNVDDCRSPLSYYVKGSHYYVRTYGGVDAYQFWVHRRDVYDDTAAPTSHAHGTLHKGARNFA